MKKNNIIFLGIIVFGGSALFQTTVFANKNEIKVSEKYLSEVVAVIHKDRSEIRKMIMESLYPQVTFDSQLEKDPELFLMDDQITKNLIIEASNNIYDDMQRTSEVKKDSFDNVFKMFINYSKIAELEKIKLNFSSQIAQNIAITLQVARLFKKQKSYYENLSVIIGTRLGQMVVKQRNHYKRRAFLVGGGLITLAGSLTFGICKLVKNWLKNEEKPKKK